MNEEPNKLTKLTICPVIVAADGTVSPNRGNSFEVLLNPSEISQDFSISYDKTKTLGQLASDLKFSAIKPSTVGFDILLDNTGVVKGSSDVQARIEKLNSIVCQYNGENHEPNHVRLLWGSFLFYGRLTSMSVTYTLFNPTGKPLRAKIKMSFSGFMSTQEEARRANCSSPDMTHSMVLKAGDCLPLLCHRVYNDAGRYAYVARFNNITNFRDIPAGTPIVFPPLR